MNILKPTCEYVKPVADCHGNISKATPIGRNQTVWSFKAKPNNAYSRKESPTTPGKEQKVY
jgi:hypothetical protein